MSVIRTGTLAVLLAGVVVSAHARDVVDATLADRLARLLDRAEALGFGGQVLVGVDGEIVFHEAYGTRDWDTREPFTTETPTGIASVTKMLTAALTLSLVDDGLLDPADSLGALLPDVRAENAGITLDQLPTHTSGLPGGYLDPAADASIAEAAARALAARRDTSRVGTWRYSSEGFLALAAVAERATGRTWEELLRTRVLEPAGMEHTTTRRRRPPASAHAYVGLDDMTRTDVDWANAGAGDVFSTARDLFRWAEVVRARTVLSASSWSLVTTPYADITDGYAAGYGTFLRAKGATPAAIEHGGDDLDGYGAFLGIFRDPDVTLVITSNARDSVGRWWRRALGDPLEAILFDGADPAGEPLVPVATADRGALVGTYAVGTGALHLIDTGGPLLLAADGQDALDALAGHPDAALDAANRRARVVADSLLAGRVDGGFGLLVDADTRPLLTAWWQGYTETWGPLRRARVPGSERDGEGIRTYLDLVFERGTRMIQLVTDTTGALQELNPDRVAAYPLVLPVAREASGVLHAEDPFSGRAVRLRVRDDRLEFVGGATSAPRVAGMPGWRPSR